MDDDRDGLFDEDGPDDLDGDGHITEMRVGDPNGRFRPHPDFPQLMIPAKDDEPGQYRLLGTEGYDNDGDGRVNEDGVGFYDPNRSWAWQWQPRYAQHGSFRYPFSIAETRMVADFVMAHPNIAGAQSYHTAAGMFLRPPGQLSEKLDPADLAVYTAIGKRGEEIVPGYRSVDAPTGLYEVLGGEFDWFFNMQGVFCYVTELFPSYNFFHKPSKGDPSEVNEQAAAFDKYLLLGDGVVPWREVDHPQYGRIEVGGMKKNWGRQAPSFLLEGECHRNMAFALYHADQLPKVEIQSASARRLGGGLIEVTAVIANPRITPTHAAADLKNKITPPDLVSLEGKEATVVLGLWDQSPFFLDGKEQKQRPAEVRVPNVPGMGAVCVRWLIRGEGPYMVSVRSAKGGVAQREVRF